MTEPLILEKGPLFRAAPGWQWRCDPPSPHVFLNYGERPMPECITAFMVAEKKPMDLNAMGLMLQAVVEEGMAGALDLAIYRAALHFTGAGLVTMNGRRLH